MPDAHYTLPRLAALYDTLSPPDSDTRFYAALARGVSGAVLDIGCGTGRLALELAHAGNRVVGLDPAPAMLAIAAAEGAPRASFLLGDARRPPLAAGVFELAFMTGHAFQVLLTAADIAAMLSEAHRVLAPGGRLAFETRNPAARAWEHWNPEESRQVIDSAEGRVEEWHRVTEVALPFVRFESLHRFIATGAVLVSESTLHFPAAEEVVAQLEAAGFAWSLFGDWDGSPLTAGSPEIIAVATKAR